jgi:hypothetical protein
MVRDILRQHRPILLLLALFLVIGLAYSVTTPLFEAPAEGSHFRYARFVAERGALPPIPADIQFPQEHQAPLYYLLTGLLISPLDLSQPPLPEPNPYHVYNNPGPREDNRNSYYHTPAEAFPYRGAVLAVHLGRLVSLIMGGLTVLATYAVACELLAGWPILAPLPAPDTANSEWRIANSGALHSLAIRYSLFAIRQLPQVLALGAALLTALNPQFVFISSVMSNDTTASAMSAWALFFALRILRRGITWQRSLLLGASVGLAAASKLNGLVMLGLAVLALALAGLPIPAPLRSGRAVADDPAGLENGQRRGLALWLGHTLLVGLAAGVIAGWWYARNWVLYRDPFTLKLAAERWNTSGGTRNFRQILGYWREIEVGFWGLFGHDNLLMDPFVYDVLHVVELLAAAGLVAWAIRIGLAARRGRISVGGLTAWAGLGLVALAFLAALAGLYRWLQVTDLPAGRYLYPALAAVNIWLFLGLSGLTPRRLVPILAGGLGAGLLALTLVTPFRYIAPAYALPPLVESDETIPGQAEVTFTPGQLSLGGPIKLVGYEIHEEAVEPGGWLHVTLYWLALEPPDTDLTVALRLLGRDGQVIGSKDTFPGLGRYPTSLWQPGRVTKDTYPVQVAFDAQAPSRLSFDVALYHRPTMFVLPKRDQAGNEVGQLALGEAKLLASGPSAVDVPNSLRFNLGSEIELVGYALAGPDGYTPGSVLMLTCYWRAVASPSADYTVFVHLLDQAGQVVAGWDAPPVHGNYPTHLWAAQEVVEDVHEVTLPPDLQPGDYQLVVGLYRLDTLQRLPAVDPAGQPAAHDAVPLRRITVPARRG